MRLILAQQHEFHSAPMHMNRLSDDGVHDVLCCIKRARLIPLEIKPMWLNACG